MAYSVVMSTYFIGQSRPLLLQCSSNAARSMSRGTVGFVALLHHDVIKVGTCSHVKTTAMYALLVVFEVRALGDEHVSLLSEEGGP